MSPLYDYIIAIVGAMVPAMLVAALLWWESYCIGRNERVVRGTKPPEFWLNPHSDARRATRNQEPVGVTEHLHEPNDEWAAKLPVGTKLYTQAQCVPEDFISHHHDWRLALVMAIENAETDADKDYMRHQLNAFDRAYAEIGVRHAD